MSRAGQDTPAAGSTRTGQTVPTGGTVATPADAVVFAVSGATFTDPSNITSGTPTQSGDDITFVFDAFGISNFPDTAAYLERTVQSIHGAVADFDVQDIFRAILRVSVLAPPTDVHVGMSLESADGQRGVAWRIASSSGDWMAQHGTKTTGTWSAWQTSTAQTLTQGFEGMSTGGNSTTQHHTLCSGVDALGANVSGAGNTNSTGTAVVGSDLTKLRVFAGFITGSGGGAGSLTVKAGHIHSKRLEWTSLARFFA